MSAHSFATLFLSALIALPAGASSLAWINEIHYDNAGTDTGEGVEIAGFAGLSLEGWTLELYNGSSGAPYRSLELAGLLPDQSGGFGTLFFDTGAMQNGAPDGLALVDALGTVLQFLSYEGTFVATSGAAAGLASIDIGVAEAADTPAGLSLQLTGTGTAYADFAWLEPRAASYGAPNAGQRFAPVPLPPAGLLFGSVLGALTAGGRRLRSAPRAPRSSR